MRAETPGPTGPFGRGAPGTDYVYRIDTRGRVVEDRNDHDPRSVSPLDLSYFFGNGPNGTLSWRDASGVTHPTTGKPPSVPFRDRSGRFWGLQGDFNESIGDSQLVVYEKPWRAGREVKLRQDNVTAAAAGCDGAVWALTRNGHVWRIDGGGRTARIVTALPVGTGRFGAEPYRDGGTFVAMRGGSVWLAASRTDILSAARAHLLHLGARGVIGELSPGQTDAFHTDGFFAIAEGPDSALWGYSRAHQRLARLSAQGTLTTYPAPQDQLGTLQLGPGPALWYMCDLELCSVPGNA